MLCSSLVVVLHRGLVDANALGSNDFPDALFKEKQVVLCDSVRLRDHRDEVHARAEALHDLNIKWLQTKDLVSFRERSTTRISAYVCPVGRMK